MKYLCLMYVDEREAEALSPSEMDGLVEARNLIAEELRANGRYIASAALQTTKAAATIRVDGERVLVLDGPFSETNEQLGGFYLIEARDLNQAIQVAARIPPGRLGAIEVRPLAE